MNYLLGKFCDNIIWEYQQSFESLFRQCDQVSPQLKTSTIKPPTASTLRSIQTTKQIKKATTSLRTTKMTRSPTRAPPKLSDQLVFATTTSQKRTTTQRQRRIFQNQRYASKRPSSNLGTENLFSGALLITTPSVISQPSTTSTTIKKFLCFYQFEKLSDPLWAPGRP